MDDSLRVICKVTVKYCFRPRFVALKNITRSSLFFSPFGYVSTVACKQHRMIRGLNECLTISALACEGEGGWKKRICLSKGSSEEWNFFGEILSVGKIVSIEGTGISGDSTLFPGNSCENSFVIRPALLMRKILLSKSGRVEIPGEIVRRWN